MPSYAFPLWLVLAAAQPDPLSPPPVGKKANVAEPTSPATPSVKAPPTAAKPAEPKVARSPLPQSPSKPAQPTVKPGKAPARLEAPPANLDEPEEEIVADPNSKSKLRFRRPPSRKSAPTERTAEPTDRTERKSAWSADRYAAVVPPGLTLAALRSQLAKAPAATTEAPAPAAEHSSAAQTVADIEKARESLRQETARLEALLKSAGGCAGVNMPIGEPLASASPLSPSAVREAPSEQIDAVSKAIKGMKPEQAAAMVGRLDRTLAAEILHRMKAADAGAILGLLKPELAAELATVIATRKPAPSKDKRGAPK